MDVDAAQIKMLAVEEEAAIGGPLEPAEAEGGVDFIDRHPVREDLRDDAIEVRVIGVPKARVRDRVERLIDLDELRGSDLTCRHCFREDASVGGDNLRDDGACFHCPRVVNDLRPDADGRGFARHVRRRNVHAVPRDMQRVRDHQVHVAIDPAAEDVFAGAGRQTRVPVVVDADGEDVLARPNRGADVETETGVPAAMFADAYAVDEHLRLLEHAVEFEKDSSLCFPSPGTPGEGRVRVFNLRSFPIPPISHIKLRRAEVWQVKRVRQPDRLPRRVVEVRRPGARHVAAQEFPLAVEIHTTSHQDTPR